MAAVDDLDDKNSLKDDRSPNGVGTTGGNDLDTLTKVEDDLAYCSEKILNLETLLTQVAGRAHDFDTLNEGDDDILNESVENAFELDILSGILDMQVTELQSSITATRNEFEDFHKNLSHDGSWEKLSAKIEEKLHDAEESIKKLQDLLVHIRKQSARFKRTLGFCPNETWSDEGEELGNGHLPDQPRHILQQYEKSLARELDLEKKLSDSISYEADLKLKLHYAERELYCMEELMEIFLEKIFLAENAAELLLGISKELAGKLKVVQLNLTSSIHREHDLRSQLQDIMIKLSVEEAARKRLEASGAEHDAMLLSKEKVLRDRLQEAEDQCTTANSKVLALTENVRTLEEQLKESDKKLQLATASIETNQEQQLILRSELGQMENAIHGLKVNVLQTESRAESAETKCKELSQTNRELIEELGFVRNSEAENVNVLERKLKELETQLEHAKASFEANQENTNMLYAAIADMENTIEDLKRKVSKAESKADSAESKCSLLTETNLELNEELGFLRGRVECLETSLHQAEETKVATVNDIGIRTRIISDLIMKLALQREHLQLQVSALTKKKKAQGGKCKRKGNNHILSSCKGPVDEIEEALTESSTTDFQVVKSAGAMAVSDMGMETTFSAEDCSGADSKIGTVRNIEVTKLDQKYFFMAILVLFISVLTFYMYQHGSNHD